MDIYKSEHAVYAYNVFTRLKHIFDVIYDWSNVETGTNYERYYLNNYLYFEIRNAPTDGVNARVSVVWDLNSENGGTPVYAQYDFQDTFSAHIAVYKTDSTVFICFSQGLEPANVSVTYMPTFIINTVSSYDDVHVISDIYNNSVKVYGDYDYAGAAPQIGIHGRYGSEYTFNILTTQVVPFYNVQGVNKQYDNLYQILYSDKKGIVVFNSDNWLLTGYFATPAGEITETTIT